MRNLSNLLLTAVVCVSVRTSTQHGGFEINPDQEPEDTLRRSDFIRNKDHLKEHLTDIDFDPDKATPEELDFHFFNLHDMNADDQLDGLELLAALTHHVEATRDTQMEEGVALRRRSPQHDRAMRRHNIAVVDKILADDDEDKNGYINYAEFAYTRRASELLLQIAANQKT